MLVLDVKRTKEDFLRKKGKSSVNTFRNYTQIFTHIEKFCLRKYDSSLENIIEDLAIIENPQEQVENLIQTYIDEQEIEGKPYSTVLGYSTLAINYLKYRRVKFDKDELQTSLSYRSGSKQELYPITKKDIQTLLDHASFEAKTKILLQSGSGFRISEVLGLRKCDINRELERYTANIRAEFAKGNRARTTIISIEAMRLLDKILENKTDNEFIFPHTTKDRINAVIGEIVSFKTLRKRAGLDMKYEGKQLHKITTHSFRAFFVSQFEKTYSGFGHSLSGHANYMKQYERFTIEEKIEKYIETEKHLLIYSKSDESNNELRELKTKVSRLEELLSQKGINLNDLK